MARHLAERPDDFVVRLIHPDFETHPRFAPLLVRLTGAHDPLLDASVALAVGQVADMALRSRQVGGWIFDNRDQELLAKHLSARLTIQHPEGKARLRFHDPRVMAQLELILTQGQLAWFVDGLEAWWYMDEEATLQELSRPQVERPVARLRANDAQWQALQRTGAVNEVVRALRMTGMAYRIEWLKQAHTLLERAHERGHADLRDQVAYAVHALWLHPQFDTHPAVRRALAAAREREAGFCVAMSGFNEVALDGIAQDLEREQEDDRKGHQAG